MQVNIDISKPGGLPLKIFILYQYLYLPASDFCKIGSRNTGREITITIYNSKIKNAITQTGITFLFLPFRPSRYIKDW